MYKKLDFKDNWIFLFPKPNPIIKISVSNLINAFLKSQFTTIELYYGQISSHCSSRVAN